MNEICQNHQKSQNAFMWNCGILLRRAEKKKWDKTLTWINLVQWGIVSQRCTSPWIWLIQSSYGNENWIFNWLNVFLKDKYMENLWFFYLLLCFIFRHYHMCIVWKLYFNHSTETSHLLALLNMCCVFQSHYYAACMPEVRTETTAE